MVQFIRGMPIVLDESAWIDGGLEALGVCPRPSALKPDNSIYSLTRTP